MFINRKDFGCGCNLVGTNKFCGDYIYEEYGAYQCLCEVCHAERTEWERFMRDQKKQVVIDQLDLDRKLDVEGRWKTLALIVFLVACFELGRWAFL